jgi:hypothetical protein
MIAPRMEYSGILKKMNDYGADRALEMERKENN